HNIRPEVRMGRPICFPRGKGFASQQKIYWLGQPLLHHPPRYLVSIKEKPSAIFETVALTILRLYDTVDRPEFTCNYFYHYYDFFSRERAASNSSMFSIIARVSSRKPSISLSRRSSDSL